MNLVRKQKRKQKKKQRKVNIEAYKKIVIMVTECGVEPIQARHWMHLPNDDVLEGKSPIQMIQQGEQTKLVRIIKQWRKKYESVQKTYEKPRLILTDRFGKAKEGF